MGVELGAAVGRIEIDASGVTKGITAAQDALKGAHSSLASIGGAATSAGAGLMTLGAPLVAFGVASAKVAGDFESQMNILAVAAKGGSTSLDDLRNVALQAGSDINLVGVSASDVAGAMTNFSKAGLDTNAMLGNMQGYLGGTAQMGGALRAAIDLAAASELDLDQASQLVVTTMSTFGLSADEASGAMNNYVQAADASVASVGDLAAAMANIGPTMAAFGFPLNDVNTALAVLSTRGITGAEAGTALKSMFTNLMRSAPEATQALDELNVSLYDEAGAMRSMPDILADLSTAMAGMTDEQRNAYVQTLAGSYGMKAMNTLLAEGKDGWDSMADAIAGGASMQETAAARTQGFNASMEQLKDAVQTFLIQAGTPLIRDVLTPLVRTLSQVFGWLSTVNPEFIKLAVAAGAVLVGMGGLLVTFGKVAGAISNIATVARLVGPLFAGLGPLIGGALSAVGAALAPLLPIILAVAAVAGLLYLAWKNNFLGLRDLVEQVGYALGAVFDFIKSVVGGFWEFLTGQITWEEFTARVRDVFGDLRDAMSEIWPNIQGIIANAWETIKGVVSRALFALKQIVVSGLAEFLAPIFGGVDKARIIVEQAFQNIGKVLADVWEGIKTAAGDAWAWMTARFEEAKETIRTIVGAIVLILSGDLAGAWETAKTALGGFVAAVGERFGEIVATVGAKVGEIVAKLKQAWEDVKGFIGRLFGKGQQPQIGSPEEAAAASAAWKRAFGEAQAAWTAMQAVIVAGAPILQTTITTLWATLQTTTQAAWTAIQTSVTTIVTALQITIATWLITLSILFQTTWLAIQTNTLTTWAAIQAFLVTTLGTLLAFVTTTALAMQTQMVGAWEAIRAGVLARVEAMRAGVVAAVQTMVDQVLAILQGAAAGAYAAGAGLARAFGDGIRAEMQRAIDDARRMAEEIRSLLPGSDARTGPLSDLTASGRALPETLGAAIRANKAAMVGAAQAMAGAVSGVLPRGGALDWTLAGRGAAAGMLAGGRTAPSAAPARPAAGATGQTVNVTINNPVGQPVETDIVRQLRNLAYIGVLPPAGATG